MYDNIEHTAPAPIGYQIRTLRQAKGWTLAELARRAGSSAPTVHRYESGWDRFELATLRKIATALGARLDVRLTPSGQRSEARSKASANRLRDHLSALFWDRELRTSDLDRYPDWVLERVLVLGDWAQVVEVREFYGDAAVLRAISRRGVDARTRVFWDTLLGGEANASEGA
jgi:transcriptional regulator with XRE-family HTH domain